MLTYTIRDTSRTPADLSKDKGVILKNALARCPFIVGDRVRFKKHKRNPLEGVIVDIESHMDKVTWTHGGYTPANIIVDVFHGDNVRRVSTTYKKLVAIK